MLSFVLLDVLMFPDYVAFLVLSVSVFIQRRACYGIKCAEERERVFNVPELVSRM